MGKKMIGALLTAVSMLSALTAGVAAEPFGGSYPEHPVTNPPVKEQENSVKDCWTESDPDYVFTVGGKKFVLLDTDGAGNYFVLAEEEYGKHPYSTAYEGSQIIETRVEAGAETSYVPGAAHDMVYDNWKFDTDNIASIGYWLNHDFLENGNGSYRLPDVIKEHIIEKDWPVEGYKPVVSWTAAQNYETVNNVKHAQEFADSSYQEGYTVRGKLALLSFTEYKQYQQRIGWMYCSAGWDGFMLRTPHALLTASDATRLLYKFGSVQVRNQSTNVDSSKKMLIAGNDAPDKPSFYVRPAMWLSKDFFTSVAIDLASAGCVVKEEIAKNSLAELSGVYSDEELEQLGFDVENAPKTENQSVAGTPAEGAVLYAKYHYVSPLGKKEANTEIIWYSSNSADGEYTPLGISGTSIKTDSTMNGSYIKYRVMPGDETGACGKYFWSEPAAAVCAMDIPVVSGVDTAAGKMGLTLWNPAGENKTAKVVQAVFDEGNELVSVSVDSVVLTAGEETIRQIALSKPSGGRIAVMVWTETSQPVFYMNL